MCLRFLNTVKVKPNGASCVAGGKKLFGRFRDVCKEQSIFVRYDLPLLCCQISLILMCAQCTFRLACTSIGIGVCIYLKETFLLRGTQISDYHIGIRTRGYNTFFMLNSAEHEIFSADKYVNANNT